MIKAHNIKCNARSRRDERRKEKQQAFAEANPLLVGRRYTKVSETVWFVYRAHYQPKELNAIAKNIFRSVREYRNQIIRATYLYEYEFGTMRDKKVRKHLRVCNEANRQIHAVQKIRGKSIPAYYD